MASVREVEQAAATLYSSGNVPAALRLYDALLAAYPLFVDVRLRVADCLAKLNHPGAEAAYRATGLYAVKAGRPLVGLVAARALEAVGRDGSDVTTSLVAHYGSESGMTGKFAARVANPDDNAAVNAPDLHAPAPADFADHAARRAAHCTDGFSDWPEALHPIPLLSTLSEAALRRVLAALLVKRVPRGAMVIREGEPGQSFFLIAGGELRVFATDGLGRQTELARLRENAVFGEMALLSAQPRSASVEAVGDADVVELGRTALTALADELPVVAEALHGFTRERLLGNLMATRGCP